MAGTGCPKLLWDDSLELAAYIRSNTTNDVLKLNRETRETVMSGETSDISQFCEFAFFDWVKYRD